MRSSEIFLVGMHVGSVTKVVVGSVGCHANPMKTASVNKELTLTMPSSAVMWIVVPNLVLDDPVLSMFMVLVF